MANVKSVRKKISKIIGAILVIIIAVLTELGDTTSNETPITPVEGAMELHMIDCGQADSFLFIQGEDTALIDCGTRSSGEDVVAYIKELGITQLDYVIGTHPHDDHMGGMYDVITNFEVGKVIINEATSTANWFSVLIDELIAAEHNVEYAEQDAIYQLGEAKMEVIGLLDDYNDTNDSSIVMKVSFGEMDVIMTGDAEKHVEEYILELGKNIEAEILKAGHHGSDTSTSDEFLEAVNPEHVLISCGFGNKYDHPIKSTMQKFEARNIEVYRTDECGSVVATITSDSVTFSCEPGDYLSGPELEEREASK